MKHEELKIVVIGGGSSYTPEIAEGLIRRKDRMKVRELALVDIDSGKEKMTVIEEMIGRMFRSASMETKLSSSTEPEEALKDCDFIICQIRAGGLRSRMLDEQIPLKYGLIGQETTGVGGLFNGLRSVPQVIALAKLAERICPDAWFINFANPAGMVAEAILKETRVKAVGLCNVPINMTADIAAQLQVKREEIYVRYFGLNHLSWVTGVRHRGKEVLPALLDSRESRQLLSNVPQVQGAEAFIKKLGAIPSPYLTFLRNLAVSGPVFFIILEATVAGVATTAFFAKTIFSPPADFMTILTLEPSSMTDVTSEPVIISGFALDEKAEIRSLLPPE